MASIFSWLRRVWSGSRNEPYRDHPVTYASSHPPSHLAQTSHTKGPTATTSELPVAEVGYPDLTSAVQGILNLHLNTTDNTFTSNPNIGPNPGSGSTPGLGGIISICLNTTDNTWTSDRPIYLDPINEGTPELGAGPTRTSSVAATSSPSTVHRHDHASLRGSVLGSTTSVASGSERGQSTRYRGQRSASAVSHTERDDSTHRIHDLSASSTHTLSPAPSNAASLPRLSERELFTSGRNERGTSTSSSTERGDSQRTHGRSPSSAGLLSPAAELESTHSVNREQSRRFNPTFSPPTPSESSAVPHDGPFTKWERSPSMSPSGSSRQVNGQPEMEQIAGTRAQPAAVTESFRTPSKPTRHSTIVINAPVGGPSTPPMTDSARRHAFGAQIGESSRMTLPPSPTSPTPSHRDRTINPPVTVAQPTATANPPQTISQPIIPSATQFPASPVVVGPAEQGEVRPAPVRPDPNMEFTSLREIYAQPLSHGYRRLPKVGPACIASGCDQRMILSPRATQSGENLGRWYYKCPTHNWLFGTFADLRGEDASRLCSGCNLPSRQGKVLSGQKRGQVYWRCLEMKCPWREDGPWPVATGGN